MSTEAMNEIEQLLRAGDLRTTGQSAQVVRRVLAEPALFETLVAAMLSPHRGVCMRAADAAEKITRVHPRWLDPHQRLLIERIATSEQKELRWHAAQMLPRLILSQGERARVFDLLLAYLGDDSRLVKTCAMQALAELAVQEPAFRPRVRALLQRLSRQGSPAMRARGRKLLAGLPAADDGP